MTAKKRASRRSRSSRRKHGNVMTMPQLARWTSSKVAEGWLGRRQTVADAKYLAGMMHDMAVAIDQHRDHDANALMARIEKSMDGLRGAKVFVGRAKRTK